MGIREDLRREWQDGLKEIRALAQGEKTVHQVKQWVQHFLRLAEGRARMERLGENVDMVAYHACWRDLQKYEREFWAIYEGMFGLYLPEEVVACAREVERNLDLLVGQSAEPGKKRACHEIEQRCTELFLKRESMELIFAELERLCPSRRFGLARTCLKDIQRVWDNLYLPSSARDRLREYAAEHGVDLKKMDWFVRPGIEEIPLLLPCDREAIAAEAMVEVILRAPEDVPKIETIYYESESVKMAAGCRDYEQSFGEARHELASWNQPLWSYIAPELLEIRAVVEQGELLCEVFSHRAGALRVDFLKQKVVAEQGSPYLRFTMGSVQVLKKPFLLKVWLDEGLIYKRWLQVKARGFE